MRKVVDWVKAKAMWDEMASTQTIAAAIGSTVGSVRLKAWKSGWGDRRGQMREFSLSCRDCGADYSVNADYPNRHPFCPKCQATRHTQPCQQCGEIFKGRPDKGKPRVFCSNECQRASLAKADEHGGKHCIVCGEYKDASHFIPISKRFQRTPDCRTCRNEKKRIAARARGLKRRPNRSQAEQLAHRIVEREVTLLRQFARAVCHRWVSLARPLWNRPKEPESNAMLSRARYHFNPEYRAYQILKSHKRDQVTRDACDGTLTPPVLVGLYARAKVCGYCGSKMRSNDKSLDHLVPISRGGVHGIENVEVVCLDCNITKNASTALEFFMRKAA